MIGQCEYEAMQHCNRVIHCYIVQNKHTVEETIQHTTVIKYGVLVQEDKAFQLKLSRPRAAIRTSETVPRSQRVGPCRDDPPPIINKKGRKFSICLLFFLSVPAMQVWTRRRKIVPMKTDEMILQKAITSHNFLNSAIS